MTVIYCYTRAMTLLSVQSQGFLWCFLVALLCTIAVHGLKLAALGYRSLHRKPPPEPPKQPEKEPEPVYFLVERKKKRTKAEYSEPKQINFQ